MTPAERKALLFLAAVAALGAGTRMVRSAGDAAPTTPETRAALARQIARVDSARRAGRGRRARTTTGRAASDSVAGRRRPAGRRAPAGAPAPPPIVDLDVAGVEEIEGLPRLGPALARRVVEERERGGPYGSLAGLERVRGIGPAVAKAVAPYVTFSGTPRPTNAEPDRVGTRSRADGRGPAERRRVRVPVGLTPPPRAPRRPGLGAAGVAFP